MVSSESEIQLQALPYLMTVVIHRLRETDPACWQDLLEEIKAERNAIIRGTPGAEKGKMLLTRAFGIVEHALAQEAPSAKPPKSTARKDGK